MFTDVMCDIETSGTDPGNSAILQIAAVKFNYDTGEIGEIFDRCLSIAPNRFWNEDTRIWWGKQNKEVLDNIVLRMEQPEPVLRDFIAFASKDAPNGGYRFWSKPTHFDFSFIASYCNQFGLPHPFHFRIARDLNTFMAAMAGSADHVAMDHIPVPVGAHNALVDCVYQLKMLFAAKTKDFGPGFIELAEYEEVTS